MAELRIVLLGKQGAGKSASGNTLLRSQSFHTAAGSERVTRTCVMGRSTLDEQEIKVIDTPGWCDSPQLETDIKQEIIRCISMSSPGPHVFLLVLPIGRFTNEEINTVMNIMKEFGDEVSKYMIVLFTKGDDLEERPIEDYLKELHSDLKAIIQIYGGRYHVFNNRDKSNQKQVSSLLMKINKMVERNEEKCYTTAMYQKAKDQKSDEGRQQCRREKDNSVPDESKSHSTNQNGDKRSRHDGMKGREHRGISEAGKECSQKWKTQQQTRDTQHRECERIKQFTMEVESEKWEKGEEQRRREKPGEDDKRQRSYEVDDAIRRYGEENGEISREIKTLKHTIKQLNESIIKNDALKCMWSNERDKLITKIHELKTEVMIKNNELKQAEMKNEELKQQFKEQTEMFEKMEKLWAQQKTQDEKTKSHAFFDFFQSLFNLK
ncbi:GTPase IMAP family member 4-like [Puntigrus tetrazona]|uniref:GTPase IMAP family member 4-like n=1 Tax=Puntigrus tetrazona TaxID=1606681 RepID=UPI001C897073|nr:GTPase IMAP family member 4-like [Puntigrus tetrazona]XP_043081762.1 GTPase IMAP family member 4-like [Puntigrus tetrazona]